MNVVARLKDRWISWRVSRVLKRYLDSVRFQVRDSIVFLHGSAQSYEEFLDIGLKVGSVRGVEGVVNEVEWPGKAPEGRREVAASKALIGDYDVVIIGAGIIGSMIARELSKYEIRVALVDKNPDVAMGVTKANNGIIHSGLEEPLGKIKTKLCVRGNAMYDELARELGVRFKRIGGLWLITLRSMPKLKDKLPMSLYVFMLKYVVPLIVKMKAMVLGVPGVRAIRSIDEVKRLEPHVCDDVVAAIQVPTVGIVEPYELAIALVENAVENGVDTFFETEVLGFEKEDNKVVGVITNRGIIRTKIVINAAGLYADVIAELAGAKEYTIHPRKGTILLFDKRSMKYLSHEIAEIELPRPPRTKGGAINPTVSGNVMWGPTAIEVSSKEDTSTSREDVELLIDKFAKTIPSFKGKLMRIFAGVRPATFNEDFIIRPAKWVKGFIHVAGIQSPGIAAAPAIAKLVINILRHEGIRLVPKKNFKATREPELRFNELPAEKQDELIRRNPEWGNVVCQCELVTEAEVINAIERMKRIGVKTITLDGVKFRTRIMMGNCQGSFCRLRVASIISRHCGIDLWKVSLRGGGSEIGVGDVKVLLQTGVSKSG